MNNNPLSSIFQFLSLDVGKVRQFISMLKVSGTYTAMSWFPMHAALVAMIGFKVGYISEKSVPTNLNSGLFFLWTFIELTSCPIETKRSRP